MKPSIVPDSLTAILDDAWQRLSRGSKDRRAAFHTPFVATRSDSGVRQRVMVLRAVDRAEAMLRFHTDRRSAKVAIIGKGAPVSVTGYDPVARIQVSVTGNATVTTNGAEIDDIWQQTALSSRRGYLIEPGPGVPVSHARSGLPANMLNRVPTDDESVAGRANFAILKVAVEQIEWLELTAEGNRRAIFNRHDTNWAGTWLIP